MAKTWKEATTARENTKTNRETINKNYDDKIVNSAISDALISAIEKGIEKGLYSDACSFSNEEGQISLTLGEDYNDSNEIKKAIKRILYKHGYIVSEETETEGVYTITISWEKQS